MHRISIANGCSQQKFAAKIRKKNQIIKRKMKNFTVFAILQVVIFAILAILATAYFVGSLIQTGEFCSWHIAIFAIVILTHFLVYLSIKEAKDNK